MAATFTPSSTIPNDVWGLTEVRFVDMTTAPSDYVTGGYPVTPGQGISLKSVYWTWPIGGQGGLAPVWNPATSNIQIFGSTAAGTPLGLGPKSTTSTAIGVTSNVITVTMANTLAAGQFILLSGFTAGGAINGTIVEVASATAASFTANYPTPNITAATADVTGTYQLIQAGTGNLLTTGTAAAITNSLATSSLITMTCANTFKPGEFVIIQGLTNGANANGVIVQVATASGTQFTANWTGTSFTTAADTGTATLLVTSGGAPVTLGTAAAISNSVATASSAGVAGVITLTALNSLVPGNIVVVQGLTNGAAVNGDLLVVNQASLTNASFVGNHKTAAITTGADVGTAVTLVTGTPAGSPSVGNGEVAAGTDLSSYNFNLLMVGN